MCRISVAHALSIQFGYLEKYSLGSGLWPTHVQFCQHSLVRSPMCHSTALLSFIEPPELIMDHSLSASNSCTVYYQLSKHSVAGSKEIVGLVHVFSLGSFDILFLVTLLQPNSHKWLCQMMYFHKVQLSP